MAQGPADGDKVCLGAIASPHGVRGMVRVKPFTENPRDIAAYGPVVLDDGRAFTLTAQSLSKGLVMTRLEGVTTREEAEALKGERLYVTRAQLPQAAADEVYQADLIGLAAIDPDMGVVGRVTAVFDFGAGEMLEVKPLKGKPVLLPFGDDNPITIDAAGVHLAVDPVWLEDDPKGEKANHHDDA